MIIIKLSKPKKDNTKQYRVVTTGGNNEILKTSENLSSKQKCWGNILADILENYPECYTVSVLDETVKKFKAEVYSLANLKKKAGKK